MNGKCKKCGSSDTYWREIHPDTGFDEIVLCCKACGGRDVEVKDE